MDLPFSRGEILRGAAGVVACLFLTLFVGGPAAEAKASKPPLGAVKVSPRNVALVAKGVWCGKAPGKWKSYVPGKRLLIGKGKRKKTYFISALQQAKQARSAGQARRFERTHRRYLKECRKVEPLRFDLRKAIGVARGKKKGRGTTRAGSLSSNLQTILPSGALRDAVVSGGVNVLGYWLSPSGSIFLEIESLELNNATYLPREGGCSFIEVERASGVPTCVDPEILGINVSASAFGDEVQFDAMGNVYYAAWAGDPEDPGTSRTVLRRRSQAGQITQLSEGEVIQGFQVLPDNSVLASGFAQCLPPAICTGSPSWLKRFTPPPSESQQTLLTVGAAQGVHLIFGLTMFPDGNVYFYLAEPGPLIGTRTNQRIVRYLTAENRLDPEPWISIDPSLSPQWPLLSVCTPTAVQSSLWPCSSDLPTNPGSPASPWFEPTLYWGNIVTSPTGEVFVAALDSFYRAYPSVGIVRTSATVPGVGSPSGELCISSNRDRVIYCGGDENGSNRDSIMELNLSSGVEKVLLGPESGLAPYQVGVTSGGSKAIFAARRGGDRVMGEIDLATEQVTILGTLKYDLIDFLIFGSN